MAGGKSQIVPGLRRHHVGLPRRFERDLDIDELDVRYAPSAVCDTFPQIAGGRTTRRGRRHRDADDVPLFHCDIVDESEIDDVVAEFGITLRKASLIRAMSCAVIP